MKPPESASSSRARSPAPTLFGRGPDLSALRDLASRLARGSGGALVLRGEAGIGKSALLNACAKDARAQGHVVLGATGVESEMNMPFAGLHQLLQPLHSGIDDLPAPQRDALRAAFGMASLPPPEPFLIALAVLELLADAAAQQPILVIVEDAQWLDRPSSDVLAFVARRVNFEPILLLVAIREGLVSAFDAPGLLEWRLRPLERADAGLMLDDRAPGLSTDLRELLLDAAAGNPLALEELPRVLGSDGLAGTSVTPAPMPLSARLERAFAWRVVELDAATRTLLLVAAAEEGGLLSDVMAAAGLVLGGAVTVAIVDPAVSARLIEQDRGRLSFRHPLIRSAIYHAASISQRHAAHAALATVLADYPERSVWHRAAAAIGPDGEVAAELERTAEQAQRRGAVAIAVDALERAAALTEDIAGRGALLLRAAELAFDLGRRDVVLRLVREAEGLELRRLDLARMTWIKEMIDPGVLGDSVRLGTLVEMANEATAGGDRELAWSMLWLAATRCWWGDAEPTVRQRVLAAAERMGAPSGDPGLLAVMAYAAPVERGRAVVERLASSAAGTGDHVTDRLLGSAATVIGAFDLAVPFLAAAVEGLRAQSRLGHLPRALVAEGWSSLYVADWTIALPMAQEAGRLAVETGDALFGAGAQVVEAMLSALRGDSEQTEFLTVEVERIAAPVGARFLLAMGQIARGLAALGNGRNDEAYDHLQRMFNPADPAFHHVVRLWALGDLAEAAIHSGHRDMARSLVDALTPQLGQTPSEGIHTALRYAGALLADDDEAEPLFQGALSIDLARWPFARGRLLLAYGSWLRRRRRVAESRAHLRLARDSFDAFGAIPWGERARRELRASGESSRRRTPAPRDQLTSQELQIAQMASRGLSNREIGQKLYLSHRTVGSHLYRLFPRLGITSRNQLQAALSAVVDPSAPVVARVVVQSPD